METGSTPFAVETAVTSRVYIVDSYPLIRRGLKELIDEQTDMSVCGEADEGATAFSAIVRLRPDIVLVEIALHGNSGLELIKNIRSFDRKILMLVVSMHDEYIYALRAMKAGARGFVSKHADGGQVLEAIRRVRRGHLCFSANVETEVLARISHGPNHRPASPVDALSDRELEIGELIGGGATTREIAARLHVSTKTVETHRSHIKEKLGLHNGTRLLQFWVGWIAGGEENPGGPWLAPAGTTGEADHPFARACSRARVGGQSSPLAASARSTGRHGDNLQPAGGLNPPVVTRGLAEPSRFGPDGHPTAGQNSLASP